MMRPEEGKPPNESMEANETWIVQQVERGIAQIEDELKAQYPEEPWGGSLAWELALMMFIVAVTAAAAICLKTGVL